MTWDAHTLFQKEILNSEIWNHTKSVIFAAILDYKNHV